MDGKFHIHGKPDWDCGDLVVSGLDALGCMVCYISVSQLIQCSFWEWHGNVPPIFQFFEPWDHQRVGPLQLLSTNIN